MKVAVISSFGTLGGAGRAAERLHRGLYALGVDSEFIVQSRGGPGAAVLQSQSRLARLYDRWSVHVDSAPLRIYRNRSGLFWMNWLPGAGLRRTLARSPALISLHSFVPGFVAIESLAKVTIPIVWTMHDKWPFTGGCHFSGSCARYEEGCGKCPLLGSSRSLDLSRLSWWRKQRAYRSCDLTFVSPSNWLAECARRSRLLRDARIEVIANGIDLEEYKPMEKRQAKASLGISPGRQVVLFGADSATVDPRKGFQHVLPILERFKARFPERNLTLLVFGSANAEGHRRFPFETLFLGRLADEASLREAYSAADAFLCPSLEDNLPLTVIEAMSCGTPSIAFNLGGFPDLIDPRVTGYLVTPFDHEDWVQGLDWVLNEIDLPRRCRAKAVREFGLKQMAERYREVFASVLTR